MRFALIAALVGTPWSPAFAAKMIQYGNRTGQEAHVVSTSGLSTAHARVHAAITRSDAIAFCRDYVQKVTPKCILQTQSIPLKDPTGNCLEGTFTDTYGDHWRFDGRRANDDGMAKFRLINSVTGEEADGGMVSNYGIGLGAFRALCPKQAPPESVGY